MKLKHCWAPAALCGVALTCASAFAQAGQEQQHPMPGQAQQQPRQLSEKSQQAVARLHALNQTRQAYARAASSMASDESSREFLRERASEYEKSDARLMAFAQMYGVDMQSSKLQESTKKVEQMWAKETQKLSKMQGPDATKTALSTFIERNEDAIDDLRQIRGDVQEEQLRTLINERIAGLEEESTRAQQLRRQVQQTQEMKKQKD
jgi:hypothetical protein